MLTSLGTYELDARIESYLASTAAFTDSDYNEAASSDMKRQFKNERFYLANEKMLFGRIADKAIVGTIDDRIYKVYFEFTFPNAAEQMSFVKESSETCDDFLDEYEQAGNPPPDLEKKQLSGALAYKWTWNVANLVVIITPISSSWCLTSSNVKGATSHGGSDTFKRLSPSAANEHPTSAVVSTPANAQLVEQLTLILKAIEQIKLAVFSSLGKKFQAVHGPEVATSLAACVTHELFVGAHQEASSIVFLHENRGLIVEELKDSLLNEKLKRAVATAYAARMMVLGYEQGIVHFDETNLLLDKSEEFGLIIHNLVAMWGGPQGNFNTAVRSLSVYAENLDVDTYSTI